MAAFDPLNMTTLITDFESLRFKSEHKPKELDESKCNVREIIENMHLEQCDHHYSAFTPTYLKVRLHFLS